MTNKLQRIYYVQSRQLSSFHFLTFLLISSRHPLHWHFCSFSRELADSQLKTLAYPWILQDTVLNYNIEINKYTIFFTYNNNNLNFFLYIFTHFFFTNLMGTPQSIKCTDSPPSTIIPLFHKKLCWTTTGVPRNKNSIQY